MSYLRSDLSEFMAVFMVLSIVNWSTLLVNF